MIKPNMPDWFFDPVPPQISFGGGDSYDDTALRKAIDENTKDIKTTKSDVQQVKGDVAAVSAEVTSVKGSITVVSNDLAFVKGEVASVKETVKDLDTDISGMTDRIVDLEDGFSHSTGFATPVTADLKKLTEIYGTPGDEGFDKGIGITANYTPYPSIMCTAGGVLVRRDSYYIGYGLASGNISLQSDGSYYGFGKILLTLNGKADITINASSTGDTEKTFYIKNYSGSNTLATFQVPGKKDGRFTFSYDPATDGYNQLWITPNAGKQVVIKEIRINT